MLPLSHGFHNEKSISTHHYNKPVCFFYPPVVNVQGKLSALEEELLIHFASLPDTQQYIIPIVITSLSGRLTTRLLDIHKGSNSLQPLSSMVMERMLQELGSDFRKYR